MTNNAEGSPARHESMTRAPYASRGTNSVCALKNGTSICEQA